MLTAPRDAVPPILLHSMHRLLLPLLFITTLAAAENAPKPRAVLNGGADAAKSDALRAFTQQAQGSESGKPTGKAPVVSGLYLWNGRADENYKPFFQWELRFTGGSAPANDLKARIITLGPQMQVLQTGPWKTFGSLGAGKTVDVDYRLNCPAPAAYRIEAAWQGGTDGFLGWDRFMVPVSEGALADESCLACVGGNAEFESKVGGTTVTWCLWNIGGQPVPQGATVAIRFKNDQGQVMHQETWKQPANEVIAAHSAKERRLVIRKKLPTDFLSFQTQVPNTNRAMAPLLADGLETSRVQQKGEVLSAHLRNTGTTPLTEVVVSLTLLDQKGTKVATVTLPATSLAAGAETILSGAVAKNLSWDSYELSWNQGGSAQ